MRRSALLIACIVGFHRVFAGWLDATFDIGPGADGLVEQVLQVPDGHVLVCGNFTSFNGAARSYIARLNSDGSVDQSFEAHAGYWVRHMSLQPDGKIVIGGYFTTVEGQSRNLIARLNANGSLDASFNPGSGATNIIAGGIDGNMTPFVFWTDIQPDGKIIITGNFREYNGASSVGIARLNPDGSRDASFQVGGGFDSWGRTIKVLSNGQILVGGWFTSYNGLNANRLVRINSDGSPDASFTPFYGDKTAIYTVAVTDDGKYITAGDSINPEGLFRRNIVRLNSDASVDSSWVGQSNDKTESILLAPDGSLFVGGYFTQLDSTPRQSLGRLFPNGTLDDNFVVNLDNFVWTIAPANDGKILISGGFTTVDGVSRRGVARLNSPAGSDPDPSTPPAPQISDPRINGEGAFEFTIITELNHTYLVQSKAPNDQYWTTIMTKTATRPFIIFSEPNTHSPRLYRVQAL
jgi:uncharacterized delta-60 repeat protein